MKGIISHPNILGLGKLEIVSQSATSPTNIELQLQDKYGRSTSLLLVLESNMLKGILAEKINFEAAIEDEVNRNNACKLTDLPDVSSSSSGVAISGSFSGTWKSEAVNEITIDSIKLPVLSNKIVLKLCVINGELQGILSSNKILHTSSIISQTIIGNNQVELQLQDISGTTDSLKLVLEKGKLKGSFSDGTSFSAVKKKKNNKNNKTCPIRPSVPADPMFD